MAISTYEKIGVSKVCEKRKNGAECIRRYKNVNLNEIQRSNECVAQDKESLERKNDSYEWSLKQKVRKFVAFLMVVWGCLQCKSSCKRTRWLTKKLSKGKNWTTSKKQKVLKCLAFLAGNEDRLKVNETAQNTLVLRIQPSSLINYRIEFNSQRKR